MTTFLASPHRVGPGSIVILSEAKDLWRAVEKVGVTLDKRNKRNKRNK
jgi:hypothetical protein